MACLFLVPVQPMNPTDKTVRLWRFGDSPGGQLPCTPWHTKIQLSLKKLFVVSWIVDTRKFDKEKVRVMSANYYMQGLSDEYHIHHGVDLLDCDTGN